MGGKEAHGRLSSNTKPKGKCWNWISTMQVGTGDRWGTACGNGITLERGLGQDKRKGGFRINTSLLVWMNGEEEKLDKNIVSSRWNGCLWHPGAV